MVVRVLNSNLGCQSPLDCKITRRAGTLCHDCRLRPADIPVAFHNDWTNLRRKMGGVEAARQFINDEIERKARRSATA